MTTNFNDGQWHGWNGGECPVHPKSLVDVVWHYPEEGTAGVLENVEAVEDGDRCIAWDQVVKFRVIKEHKEPMRLWVNIHGPKDIYAYSSKEAAIRGAASIATRIAVPFIEDVENDHTDPACHCPSRCAGRGIWPHHRQGRYRRRNRSTGGALVKLMDQKTLEATKASLAHWRRNAEAGMPGDATIGWGSCALCKEFLHVGCYGCPIFEKTGQPGCGGSPYSYATSRLAAWRENRGPREDFTKAATAMADFIEALIPEEQR